MVSFLKRFWLTAPLLLLFLGLEFLISKRRKARRTTPGSEEP